MEKVSISKAIEMNDIRENLVVGKAKAPEESEKINKIIKKNIELELIWVYLKEFISLIKRNQLPELYL